MAPSHKNLTGSRMIITELGNINLSIYTFLLHGQVNYLSNCVTFSYSLSTSVASSQNYNIKCFTNTEMLLTSIFHLMPKHNK